MMLTDLPGPTQPCGPSSRIARFLIHGDDACSFISIRKVSIHRGVYLDAMAQSHFRERRNGCAGDMRSRRAFQIYPQRLFEFGQPFQRLPRTILERHDRIQTESAHDGMCSHFIQKGSVGRNGDDCVDFQITASTWCGRIRI